MTDSVKPAIILDLDNVLFDSTMLDQYLPADKFSREQWAEFETHYNEVIPNPWASELVNLYRNAGYIILFVTSREDIANCKGTTISSISKALDGNLDYVWLFMRRGGDTGTPSAQVKKDIYLDQIKPHFDVKFALDDDESNCQMYHELGITTLKVLV